jgi:uncharacterized protein (TIGR02145 family)
MNTNYGNKAIYSEEIMVVDKKVQDGKITGRILKRGNLKNVWLNIYILGDDDYYLSLIGTLDVENQDAPPPPPGNTVTNQTANTLTDQAGNTYRTVTIGDQVWMAENLTVDRFRNGDVIPEVKTDNEWERAGNRNIPAWCYYNNEEQNGLKYGKLYNWYVVADGRGLCPVGWHVPKDDDWLQLFHFYEKVGYLGEIVGVKLKSNSGWEGKNGSNESGFNGLHGGRRVYNQFFSIGIGGDWWSSSPKGVNKAWRMGLNEINHIVNWYYENKDKGFSVRCIKD